jgi:LacI family transcriptional regulator
MNENSKVITIHDVARRAGVGVGTVSRVLNGSEQVKPLTREWVQSVMLHLGFRPNAGARRIQRRRTEMVCFILSNRDFLHSFHARILQGVESYATAYKHHVVFAAVHYSDKTAADLIELPPILQERGLVDGLILAGTVYSNFLDRIKAIHLPYVMLGNNLLANHSSSASNQVRFDDLKGEFEATRYLIGQGHRRIVFVGDAYYPWMRIRGKGYRRAMQLKKLASLEVTDHYEAGFRDYGEWSARRILGFQPRPTAVVAGNDEIAYGVWRSFRRLGVHVPDEVSLVGFDDREEALLMDPPLTTVRVHKEEIGKNLMKMLLEKLHHPDGHLRRQVLPTELVIRDSVRRL